MRTCLAVDLGAGSGRVIAARFNGTELTMEVVNRFDNSPVEFAGHLFWNLPGLLSAIREGLSIAVSRYGEIDSIGVDTWGVDYGLLDPSGRLLGLPYTYRDARNSDANMEAVFEITGKRPLYEKTGSQFLNFNTIFQLHAERQEPSSLLELADRVLLMPDLINYALCGEKANEATIASTTGLIDLESRDWSGDLLARLGLSRDLFRTPVRPGTLLGKVLSVPGLEKTPVIAVGAHDTASAVAAVPADPATDWAYLSTGTWALLGVENAEAIRSDAFFDLAYTHEGAVNGKFRYLKNCTGMWMIQQLRKDWTIDGKAPSYDELMREAEETEPFQILLDPDHAPFQSPGDMTGKIRDFCRLTGQPEPASRGAFYRAAMEGVVMRYKEVWGELEELTGIKRDVLHMIGGATRDEMHCQMTADALGAAIACGPVEGASMGNALAQLVGLGDLASFDDGRDLVRASIGMTRWEPHDTARWDDGYARWLAIKAKASGK